MTTAPHLLAADGTPITTALIGHMVVLQQGTYSGIPLPTISNPQFFIDGTLFSKGVLMTVPEAPGGELHGSEDVSNGVPPVLVSETQRFLIDYSPITLVSPGVISGGTELPTLLTWNGQWEVDYPTGVALQSTQWRANGVDIPEGADVNVISLGNEYDGQAITLHVTLSNPTHGVQGNTNSITVDAPVVNIPPEIGSVTFTPTTITEGDPEPQITVTMIEPGDPVASITTIWRDGDGDIASTPLAPGVYTASATASNIAGSDTVGSLDALTVEAAVVTVPPVIASVTFTPGTINVGDGEPEIIVTMTEPGDPVAVITTGWRQGGSIVAPPLAVGVYTAVAVASNVAGTVEMDGPDLTVQALPQVPVITNPGVVTGAVELGGVLSVSGFTATGETLPALYKWLRGEGDEQEELPGASAATYTLVQADGGNYITRRTIARNDAGSAAEEAAGVNVPNFLTKATLTYTGASIASDPVELRFAASAPGVINWILSTNAVVTEDSILFPVVGGTTVAAGDWDNVIGSSYSDADFSGIANNTILHLHAVLSAPGFLNSDISVTSITFTAVSEGYVPTWFDFATQYVMHEGNIDGTFGQTTTEQMSAIFFEMATEAAQFEPGKLISGIGGTAYPYDYQIADTASEWGVDFKTESDANVLFTRIQDTSIPGAAYGGQYCMLISNETTTRGMQAILIDLADGSTIIQWSDTNVGDGLQVLRRYFSSQDIQIGTNSSDTARFVGKMAAVMHWDQNSLDLTVPANIQKFVKPDGGMNAPDDIIASVGGIGPVYSFDGEQFGALPVGGVEGQWYRVLHTPTPPVATQLPASPD
jgi:hypothetical protein